LLFRDKSILIISPEPWNHIFVSKHHYATHLAALGNRVFFLNPPAETLTIQKTDFENVSSVTYSPFFPGLRFLPSVFQRYLIRKKFNEIQALCEVTFDVVWSFDNSVFFDFSALPASVLTISHIVDLNQNFQTAKAATSAYCCLCTTKHIFERLQKFNRRVYKINHGFNLIQSSSTQIQLPGSSKIKALYAGNLSMPFIDWQLIGKVVSENPAIDFIFVGPNADAELASTDQSVARKKIKASQNCFFIGEKPAGELIKYLQAADILLVAYQEKYHIDQANPHKLMEYLGAGKMTVATCTSEYEDLARKGLILMTDSNDRFPSVFKTAVDDIDVWNASDKVEGRKAFAHQNTYFKHIETIESYLNE
jgi:hypothetical protein